MTGKTKRDTAKRRLNSSLYIACESGGADQARGIIEQGADVNFFHQTTGGTPLHAAVKYNKPDVVRILIEHGADINAVSEKSEFGEIPQYRTALSMAVRNEEIFSCLMSHGADLNAQDPVFGYTALHWAIMDGRVNEVVLLLKSGARRDLRNDSGHTPLEFARSRSRDEIVGAWEAYEASEKAKHAIDELDPKSVRPL